MTNDEYLHEIAPKIETLTALSAEALSLCRGIIGRSLTKEVFYFFTSANRCINLITGFIDMLKSRNLTCAGVLLRMQMDKDVYVFCMDGLTGFREAINAAFPKSQIQRCIIHQIRSSTKYVNWKDMKEVMADLKAVNEDEAMNGLVEFKEKWAKKYLSCVRSWEENWDILSTFFAYPAEVRRIIYTTNIIEGLNRQFRKITKNKPSFTNDDSLRKMLYLASQNIVNHWTVVCRNWDMVSNQLRILFEERETL